MTAYEPRADDRTKEGTMESIYQTIIESQVIEALRTCFDPEIPVNIYEMGLVYDIKVSAEGVVTIQMNFSSPYCPAEQSLSAEAAGTGRAVQWVPAVRME